MKREINPQKLFLVSGVIVLAVSLCIIFPLENSKAITIAEFGYTYLTLTIALLTMMYGLMGKAFFKGLLFLLFSALFSFSAWLLLYPSGWLSSLVAFWAGIPCGIIAGLIFMLINFKFIKDDNRYQLFFKRLISYLLILLIVSYMFHNGGDWIFDVSEYFKNKNN